MSTQKERIHQRIQTQLENPPIDMDSLGVFIRNIEGLIFAIDEPNFDPLSHPIYKLLINLEEIYAIQLDRKKQLSNSSLVFIQQTVNEMKDELALL